MGTTTKTLLAASVLAAIALCFFGLGEDPTPIATPVAVTDDQPDGDLAAGDMVDGEKPETIREVALPPEAIPSWLDHPFTHELEVRMVSSLGLPVQNRKLQLGPAGNPLNESDVRTDADGNLRVSWPSRVRSGEIVFADEAGSSQRVRVQHGHPTTLTLVTEDSGNGARLFIAGRTIRGISLSGLRGGSFVVSSASESPTMQEGLHPHARFAVAHDATETPVGAHRIWFNHATASIDVRNITWGRLEGGMVVPEEVDPMNARISGTVFGEDGKPAAKVHVALLGSNGRPVFHAKTDDNGQFLFEELGRAEYTVRAGGGPEGLATSPAVTTTGTTPVTVNLVRGATIRGRAEIGGRPIAKARVTWRGADGSWCDSTKTGADGSFVLANLPGTPGTVMLWMKGRPFPVDVHKDVLSNTPDLVLRDTGATGSLLVDLIQTDGIVGFTTIRVWSEAHGVGAVMPAPRGEDEPWKLEHLAAGWYRVELFHPATGRIDAGRHYVDGKTDCHLGRVGLPQPATVRFEFEGEPGESERKLELYRIRPDLDVRAKLPKLTEGVDYQIEAGDYVLFWIDESKKVRYERFVAEAGKEVTVRIPL